MWQCDMKQLSKQAQKIGSCLDFNVRKKDKIPQRVGHHSKKKHPKTKLYIDMSLYLFKYLPTTFVMSPIHLPTLQTTCTAFLTLHWRKAPRSWVRNKGTTCFFFSARQCLWVWNMPVYLLCLCSLMWRVKCHYSDSSMLWRHPDGRFSGGLCWKHCLVTASGS